MSLNPLEFAFLIEPLGFTIYRSYVNETVTFNKSAAPYDTGIAVTNFGNALTN